jgi:hypothetical protein
MTQAGPNPLSRVMPSLTDVAFALPILFLFTRLDGARTMLSDGDTGWHIRAGEWMLQNGRVPENDIFSFSKPGEPWFAWEWLWDVLFAALHRLWGMEAVVLASIFVLSTTFALVYRLARRSSGNVLLAIAFTFAAVAGSSIHWFARPHLFTLLFTAVFLIVLEGARRGGARRLYWLPVLTVLWTNLHGGFFVGILTISAYAAGELAAWLTEPAAETRRAALVRAGRYAAAAAGCFAASFANPYTYRLHAHIYSYLTDSYHFRHVSEFVSISFHHPASRYFEAMILLGVPAAAWSIYRRRYAHAFLLFGWLHLALVSVRNIPLYLIVAAPVTAMAAQEWLERLGDSGAAEWVRRSARSAKDLAAGFGTADRLSRYPAASILSAILLTGLFHSPFNSSKLKAEYDPERYPAKAIAAVDLERCRRTIFTDDEWGDYLIYRLYPRNKVFVDGRSDYYGEEFGKAYLALFNARHDWEETLRRYGIDTVLLPVDAPLASTLKESKRWHPVYDDGTAIVFLSTGDALAARNGCPANTGLSAAVRVGTHRDREVTNINHRDPRITHSYAKDKQHDRSVEETLAR